MEICQVIFPKIFSTVLLTFEINLSRIGTFDFYFRSLCLLKHYDSLPDNQYLKGHSARKIFFVRFYLKKFRQI